MSAGLDGMDPSQRDALLALARREGRGDPRRADPSTRDVVELARRGLLALGGECATDLNQRERASIGDYVLGHQSPGQAEGTWRLLQSSPEAAEWAERLRDAFAEAGAQNAAPLPSDEGALSPTQRVQRRWRRSDGEKTLGEVRDERSRQRTAASAQQAVAEFLSPFRSEALAAHEAADDRIELPRWAPRPVQLSMYAVLVTLLAGLAFAIFIRIPVNTNALVLITDLPPRAPGAPSGGLHFVALFPLGAGQSKDIGSGSDVRTGDTLRVALPGEVDRSPVRLRWVSEGPQPPRKVIDGYRLPLGQANRVVAPGHVALAPLEVPPGKSPRSYEGTTTAEASVQTGSRRIISLLF
jgi:hypothetical protein